MEDKCPLSVLTVNCGSSSLKISLFEAGKDERLKVSGEIERIGHEASHFRVKDSAGAVVVEQHEDMPTHDAALALFFNWLESYRGKAPLDAVGHRVVHGGSRYSQPARVTPELVARLKELISLAPEHLPQQIEGIETVSRLYPDLFQAACFDTAFHRSMPRVAQTYAIPNRFTQEGIIRYGFHGLSYEYIVSELRVLCGNETAEGRVVVAHLGNGASMAAIEGGRSIDTTMGFTPTAGLVMSTRSGDLDPGILTYLLQEKRVSPEDLSRMLNEQSGLLGVSGISSDMKDLLDRQKQDRKAAEAVETFCYVARKFLGALAAVLGGLDMLVFTGGIGENAPEIRRRICERTEFLGIQLDPDKNNANAPIISTDGSRVSVRVIKTDEELMIARHTSTLATGGHTG